MKSSVQSAVQKFKAESSLIVSVYMVYLWVIRDYQAISRLTHSQ